MRFHFRDERGNIYIEAVIAVAVLAIGLLPVFGGWSLTAGAQEQTGRRNKAVAIARSYIEPLHALNSTAWESIDLNAQNEGFTIARTAALRPDNAGLKDVWVTVSWTDRKGLTQTVNLVTAVARRP